MKNLKVITIYISLFLPSFLSIAQEKGSWKMQDIPIKTRWAAQVSPDNALKEYPRPQMVRSNWTNLNGVWDYAITSKGSGQPNAFDGQILVPYPIESALSGVKKALSPEQNLWYRKYVQIKDSKTGERTLLNFGAVDWQATIIVNGKEVGQHQGGYSEFSFDITDALKTGTNEILVKVFDPTDQGIGPHGKQVLKPENIYYTPTSGIWQTVWMETVPSAFIKNIKLTPDIDKGALELLVNAPEGYQIEYTVYDPSNQKEIATGNGLVHHVDHPSAPIPYGMDIPIKNPKLWSPADPILYPIVIKLTKNGKIIDQVRSYFGMRKISIGKDNNGIDRVCLNNKPYYNLGTLDQGFWPDGLYTAPTDEALAFDIKAIKAMGFNTIRKHIKVEPARWYYWADKLGILVWQDFVNPNQGLPEGSKAEFEKGASDEMAQLHNHPSIVTWVLFNEKWGQYDQQRLSEWVKKTDPSRVLNGHSGELLYVNEQLRSPSPNAYVNADMTDVHSYPDPMMSIKQTGKAQVCGEFGGIGVFIPDHQWLTGSAWGYIQEKPQALKAKYTIMNQHLQLMVREGLSGSIYTQPFDVEGEQNGLMTYDREVIKIPFEDLRRIHSELNPDLKDKITISSLLALTKDVTAQDADITDPSIRYCEMLKEFIDGKRDALFLKKMSMMAAQTGDKSGVKLAGASYISSLKMPLSEEEVNNVIQFTKSTHDEGYTLMSQNPDVFKKVMGERKYTVALMNMIMKGEIEPLINESETPDWVAISKKIAPFGDPGAEILLRAKTITSYTKQDWNTFIPAAKDYLAQYGKNIKEEEKRIFTEELEKHK